MAKKRLRVHESFWAMLPMVQGQRFGDWTLLETPSGQSVLCQCACSKKAILTAHTLRSGRSLSCKPCRERRWQEWNLQWELERQREAVQYRPPSTVFKRKSSYVAVLITSMGGVVHVPLGPVTAEQAAELLARLESGELKHLPPGSFERGRTHWYFRTGSHKQRMRTRLCGEVCDCAVLKPEDLMPRAAQQLQN